MCVCVWGGGGGESDVDGAMVGAGGPTLIKINDKVNTS